jgi:hypothetical protein
VAREQLKEKDILCLNHLERAFDLIEPLHDVGCERDKAGNRELHFDEYCKLVLVYIWNPLIGSVHDLQQAVGLPKVAKALGIKRFSAGSFSESVRVFDPERLKPIISELAGELTPTAADPRLADLKHALTLVDGTYNDRKLFDDITDAHSSFVIRLGMRHLLSQREQGLDIQIYCTLIVCILIQLISGKKPNKAMRNIVGWYLPGLADAQDVINFLNKPDNTGVKLRAKRSVVEKTRLLMIAGIPSRR